MIIREEKEILGKEADIVLVDLEETNQSVDACMADFQKYHLSHNSEIVLRNYLTSLFMRKHHKVKARLGDNIFISCEDEKLAESFVKDIMRIRNQVTTQEKKLVTVHEKELYGPLNVESILNQVYKINEETVLYINQCLSPADFNSELRTTTATITKLFRETQWKDLEMYLNDRPWVQSFITVNDATEQSRFRKWDHLYYRIYQNHIRLLPMRLSDVREAIYQKLKSMGFTLKDEFVEDLDQYLEVVYPKADLKNDSFIEDMITRIVSEFYSKVRIRKILDESCVPFYRKPKPYQEIAAELEDMIGLKEVKRAFRELEAYVKDPELDRSKLFLHMVFSGNPGTGKTTVAQMAADLLSSMGVIQKNIVVTATVNDLIAQYVGHTAGKTLQVCQSAYGGILFIDEAYLLNSSDAGKSSTFYNECLGMLMQEMMDNRDKLLVIFAGYKKEMNDFLSANAGLRSRIFRTIEFEDYSEEELLEIFKRRCQTDGLQVEKGALNKVRERLVAMMCEPDFGNARCVDTLYMEARRSLAEKNDRTGENQKRICAEHIDLPHELLGADRSQEKLEQMVGLQSLKEEIEKFRKYALFMKRAKTEGIDGGGSNLHMVFTGNPGTGKTTVAQIMADVLYHAGLIRTNKMIITERKDLVGRYIGETAQKTDAVIQKAKGGVLFVDEAYSLISESKQDFGHEAIERLLTSMADPNENLVVIFAGYKNEMKQFVKSNPGLSSRIGYTFHFEDYETEDLTEIFQRKMISRGFILEEGVREKVSDVMEYYHVMPDFGNGRFVDKVIQKTMMKHAMLAEEDRVKEILPTDIPTIEEIGESLMEKDSIAKADQTNEEDLWITAVHETGHALVSYLLCGDSGLAKISLRQWFGSYGRVTLKPNQNSHYTEEWFRHRITILLGGRNAEKLVFGTHSSGCSSDYENAKKLAKMMIEDYAMGEIGKTKKKHILRKADENCTALLEEYKEELLTISKIIFEKREMETEEIDRVFHEVLSSKKEASDES